MTKKMAMTLVSGIIVLAALTGCASSGPGLTKATVATGTPSPRPTAADRWGTPAAAKLPDEFGYTRVQVDPDGTSAYGNGLASQEADDPKYPAPIAKNGNIYVMFSFVGGQVPRVVREGYISSDPKGTVVGPKLKCESPSLEVPQTFNCTALFTDHDYGNGVYYGVLVTSPDKGFESYGTVKVIAPFFTMKPNN